MTATPRIIVIEFTTVDGIVDDPDGSQGTAHGGWAFRYGPDTVAGDKFKLGPVLDTGALLLGRRTWELFARIWPNRSDEFARAMNRIPKHIVSGSLTDVSAWQNSTLLDGDLVASVDTARRQRTIVVAGSLGVAHALAAHDLVDEYRLLLFPMVLGTGARLFEPDTRPIDLQLAAAEPAGPAVLLRYERPR
jgi:dihydrofolate reductase